MQIFDVKSDIARILYDSTQNHLLPSDFLLIEDSNQKLIAQVINIEMTDDVKNMAVLRLALSIDKDDNLSYYNGYIPSKNSKVLYINPDEIVELVSSSETTIYLGNLSNHSNCYVKTNISLLDDNAYIQSDRDDKIAIYVKNVINELLSKKRNVIVIDFDGQYSSLLEGYRLKISENIKLPLNISAFDTILENDIVDCPIEDIATIQSIVLELREYMNTLDDKYIPFNMFKNVVDTEFISSPSSGLMLLRNKLWKYSQEGLFADNKEQFDKINSVLSEYNTVIIDVSSVEEKWYKFLIQTVFELTYQNCYLFMSLNDLTFDKKSISQLYSKKNIVPIISTSYDYQLRPLLKSLCKNQIMFKPSILQSEQEPYTNLLNRLNNNEFMVYGETTLFLPLIIDLQVFDESTADDVVQNDIKKDVDKLLCSSQSLLPKTGNIVNEIESTETISDDELINATPDDDVTDEDYDFLEDIDFNELDVEKPESSDEKVNEIESIPEKSNDEKIEDFFDTNIDSNEKVENFSSIEKEEAISSENIQQEQSKLQEKKYSVFNPVEDNYANDDDFDSIMNQPFMTIEDVKIRAEENKPEQSLKGDYIDKIDISNDKKENINNTSETEIILVEENPVLSSNVVADDELKIDKVEKLEEISSKDENLQVEQFKKEEKVDIETSSSEELTLIDDVIDNSTQNATSLEEDNTNTENTKLLDDVEEQVDKKEVETPEIPDDILVTDDNENLTNTESVNETKIIQSENIIVSTTEDDEVISNVDKDNLSDIAINNKLDSVVSENDKEIVIIDDENILVEEDSSEETEEEVINKESSALSSENSNTNENIDILFDNVDENKKEIEKPLITRNVNERINEPQKLTEYETDNSITRKEIPFKIGDKVYHPKHGKGVIVDFTNYSNKILFCRVEFENVGMRILDPRISGLEKA